MNCRRGRESHWKTVLRTRERGLTQASAQFRQS